MRFGFLCVTVLLIGLALSCSRSEEPYQQKIAQVEKGVGWECVHTQGLALLECPSTTNGLVCRGDLPSSIRAMDSDVIIYDENGEKCLSILVARRRHVIIVGNTNFVPTAGTLRQIRPGVWEAGY